MKSVHSILCNFDVYALNCSIFMVNFLIDVLSILISFMSCGYLVTWLNDFPEEMCYDTRHKIAILTSLLAIMIIVPLAYLLGMLYNTLELFSFDDKCQAHGRVEVWFTTLKVHVYIYIYIPGSAGFTSFFEIIN
jgi:hypothetical protein